MGAIETPLSIEFLTGLEEQVLMRKSLRAVYYVKY